MKINWQRGEFHKFYAVIKFALGGPENLSVLQNDEFEYDGTICKYSGRELPQPGLRSAIEKGWATQNLDSAGPVARVAPSRSMAKSQTKNTDLSKVQRQSSSSMTVESLDEDTVLNVSDRQVARASGGHLTASDNRRPADSRGFRVDRSDLDSQEGVSIGRVRSPANIGKIDVTEHAHLASDIEKRDTESGYGRAQILKGNTVTTEGITIRSNVGRPDRIVQSDEDEGVVVGQVRHSDKPLYRDGVDLSGGTNRPVNKTKKVESNPPVTKAVDEDLSGCSPKIRVARRIDPTFPLNWDFSGKLVARMARVRAHSDGISNVPVFLDALYAAEGDQMRNLMEKEFPEQFKRTDA